MKIELRRVSISELIQGYEEKGPEGIEGVVAYSGKLDVRPAYQREFVYSGAKRDEVIRSVLKGFPISVMYWSKVGEDRYELMDGQQRTISICRYCADRYQNFSVDLKYFFNLPSDIRQKMLNYLIDIYICEGTPSEVLAWFKVINTGGEVLTIQELRNVSYTGPWLSDAKLHFSKPGCVAYMLGKDYLSGSAIRQDYLETAIQWIADKDGISTIEEYMGLHQKDADAHELWLYFQEVINWVKAIFPTYRKEMKNVEWGLLYNRHKGDALNPIAIEKQIQKLFFDDDVTRKAGIYEYVLDGQEKHLNIREFTAAQKQKAYDRQKGICPRCVAMHKPTATKVWNIEEMEADHIKPWHLGGKTEDSNCQMLCQQCNREKGGR